MPLQKLPVQSLDDINHRRRARETLNKILDHSFDDSKIVTSAETTSDTAVINKAYGPGHILRYALAIDTDYRPAFERAYTQFKAGGAPIMAPAGNLYLSKSGANTYALKFDGNVHMVSEGRTTLLADDDAYNHILIDDGTDVDIVMKGFDFDHGSSSITAESTDHICVRIESSINTIHVEDCALGGFLADGFYIRADVTGRGGYFKNVTSSTGGAGRSLVYIAQGEKIRFIDCTATDIGLQGFVTAPTDNATVCRNIDFINCEVYGGGNYSTSPYHNVDRAGFYGGGVTGASATIQSNIRFINCRVHDYGNTAGGSVPLVLGIETRETTRPIVSGMIATNVGRGGSDTGLYSFLTTGAVYRGCVSTGNGKGIWMNACGEYTEEANTCIGNTTDRDYNGPDGVTNFIKADGRTTVLAWANVSFSGGAPIINASWNLSTTATDLGTGDTRFTFSNDAGNSGDYAAVAMYRSHSGTSGFIQSASQTTTTFRVLTYSALVASDQNFNVFVMGYPDKSVEP